MLAVVLAWLSASWVAIEILHSLRITVFQPFRMATVARGLALVLIAGRLVHLWERGGWLGQLRAVLIGVALAGDWMLVVVTLVEIGVALAEQIADRSGLRLRASAVPLVFAGLIAYGLFFLARHDTESGHWPLLAVLLVGCVQRTKWLPDLKPRWVSPTLLAWTVPTLSLLACFIPADNPAARWPLVRGLVTRCRFAEAPIDDVERLAVWCRENTPQDARFIGPPGPKTFRLWSRRSLAFNRAGSPYHAAGLADWFARFQDHVDVHEPPAAFVRDYLAGRHRFEARYDQLSDEQKAALAIRQGADHVIALAAEGPGRVGETHRKAGSDARMVGFTHPTGQSPLELLHTEGRYAVYRVRVKSEFVSLSQRQRQR
jgi:hypothetical protein